MTRACMRKWSWVDSRRERSGWRSGLQHCTVAWHCHSSPLSRCTCSFAAMLSCRNSCTCARGASRSRLRGRAEPSLLFPLLAQQSLVSRRLQRGRSAALYSQHKQESHGGLPRPSNAFCSACFALWTFKTSSNALDYCDKEGPKTQDLWLSQFMLIVGRRTAVLPDHRCARQRTDPAWSRVRFRVRKRRSAPISRDTPAIPPTDRMTSTHCVGHR